MCQPPVCPLVCTGGDQVQYPAHVPVWESLDGIPPWDIYSNPFSFPSPFLPFAFVSSSVLRQSVHTLYALSSHARFHLAFISSPHYPSAAPVSSALRLVSVLCNRCDSLVLFPGPKPSQTISADVFRTKGQRRRRRSVSWMRDAMKQQGFPNALLTKCQHAHSISPFALSLCLLFSDLHHHYCSFVWLLQGGIEVFSWSEVVCPLSFWAWGTSECSTKCIFVSDNANTTHRQSSYTNCCCPHHITRGEKKNNTVKPCALLFPLSHILIYGLLGLARLASSSSRPNTKMSGSECRPGRCRAVGTKGSRGGEMNGGKEEFSPLPP